MSLNKFKKKHLILDAPLTLYVDGTNGDDSNDGSQGKPFKTIQKAVYAVPLICLYHAAAINIADGIYPEAVNIPTVGHISFFGGNVRVFGFASATPSVVLLQFDLLTLYNNTPVTGISTVFGANFHVHVTDLVLIDKFYAVDSEYGAHLFIEATSSFTANNCYIVNHSVTGGNITVQASGITGSGNSIFYTANSGFIQAWGAVDPSVAESIYLAANGGRIYMGGQTDFPNY
jgi:hypothetical protein